MDSARGCPLTSRLKQDDSQQLLVDQREANSQMVRETIRAQELTEEAMAARTRAETLAGELFLTQQALRTSGGLLRTLIDTLPLLAWTARPDGWIEFYNLGWYQYTGTTAKQMEGWGWETVHDPRELPRVKAAWRRSLESGEPFELSFPLRRADGVFRWFLTRAQPLRDESGTVVRWFGTNTDIDDRINLERQLDASLAQERKLAEFRELFLGVVGHDLRNPLAAISIAAGSLLDDDGLERRHILSGQRILRSAERMTRMIAQLLDLTRSRLGDGLPIDPKPIDLADVCRDTAEEFEQDRVKLEFEGDLTGTWDPDRLQAVLSNLVGNAIEHADAGSQVVIRAVADATGSVVEVTNLGPPIPADVLPFIFDPFRRAQQHQTSKAGNLGLGLFIAKQLVVAHGGTLEAVSADSRTTLKMRLPRVAEKAPSGKAAPHD